MTNPKAMLLAAKKLYDEIARQGDTVTITDVEARYIAKLLSPPCHFNATAEAACLESFHVDDGVPYCDTCGLFRASRHNLSVR